jgi:hypothetical protein
MAHCSEPKPKAGEHILISAYERKRKQYMNEAKPISQSEQLKQLANTCLYVLTHCQFRGEDSHHVELVKTWMIDLRDNVAKQVETEAKKATEAANKPVEATEAVTLSEAK